MRETGRPPPWRSRSGGTSERYGSLDLFDPGRAARVAPASGVAFGRRPAPTMPDVDIGGSASCFLSALRFPCSGRSSARGEAALTAGRALLACRSGCLRRYAPAPPFPHFACARPAAWTASLAPVRTLRLDMPPAPALLLVRPRCAQGAQGAVWLSNWFGSAPAAGTGRVVGVS